MSRSWFNVVVFLSWHIRFQFSPMKRSSKVAPFSLIISFQSWYHLLCGWSVFYRNLRFHFSTNKGWRFFRHYCHIQSNIGWNSRMLSVPESSKPNFFWIHPHRHPLRLGDIQHCATGQPAPGHACVHWAALTSNKGRSGSCPSCPGRRLLSVRGETIHTG